MSFLIGPEYCKNYDFVSTRDTFTPNRSPPSITIRQRLLPFKTTLTVMDGSAMMMSLWWTVDDRKNFGR
jgi:hypothetical protein